MKNRIRELMVVNDTRLEEIRKSIRSASEKITAVNIRLYTDNVRYMSDDDLHCEFCDRIGNELNEFEWYMYHFGREKIEDLLINKYTYEKELELEGLDDT